MTASEKIDQDIAGTEGWRGAVYARLRELILESSPEMVEEWKWNSATWSHNGLVCGVGAFKKHVAIIFFKGASLEDPHNLFNSSLDGNTMRSVKILEGDKVDEKAIKKMLKAAMALNASAPEKKKGK